MTEDALTAGPNFYRDNAAGELLFLNYVAQNTSVLLSLLASLQLAIALSRAKAHGAVVDSRN
jgi:hypothetical protein